MATDHKAEAQRILAEAGRGSAEANDPHGAATAHALIALAEQQRIANLIAYAAMIDAEFAEAQAHKEPWDWSSYEASNARREAAQAMVREGLGL